MKDILIEFLFGPEYLNQMIPLAGALISGGASILGGIFGMFSAGKRRRKAEREKQRREEQLAALENSRQTIIDPFSSVSDASNLISNPFSNMQVATGAAEFQESAVDQSLADMVDLFRNTGQGGGGATALAREAGLAKANISNTIQQQEIANEKLRAQGQSERERIQLSEAQRVQQARVSGQQFVFGTRENREMQKLNRVAGLQEQAFAQEMSAQTSLDNAFGSFTGGAGSIGSAALLGAFSKNKET